MEIILIIPIISGVLLAIIFSPKIFKLILKKQEKKEIKLAEKVKNGDIENNYEFEGIKYPAKRFIQRNDNGKEETIEFGKK